MKALLKSNLTKLFFGLGVALAGTGCQGDESALEFAEAVPSAEMLALTMDGPELATAAAGLEAQGQALVGDPATFKAAARRVMDGINAAITETQTEVEALFGAALPVEVVVDGQTCQTWEADGALNHWLLSSCVNGAGSGGGMGKKGKGKHKGNGKGMAGGGDDADDQAMGGSDDNGKGKHGQRYYFTLKGRPLASTLDSDYLVVFAGDGRVLNFVDGDKRGGGFIGYNLDNLAALTDREVAGRLGIGYRANGKGRHLTLGLDHVTLPGVEQELNGVYRYARAEGHGGRFSFSGVGDFVTVGEDQAFQAGQDGSVEFVRAAIGWRSDGRARTVLLACDGTIGAGQCARLVQCWSTSAEVTFEDLLDAPEELVWEEAACPTLDLGLGEPPTEGECKAPGNPHGHSGAPQMPEPEALPVE